MAKSTDRETLNKKSASFKDAITTNFDEIKSNTDEISKAALIGGGIVLAGYIIYRLLRSEPKHLQNSDDKGVIVVNGGYQELAIVRNIKNAIATFILAIAKQKLVEYLNKREENKTEDA